jgi:drug/metabolite transporter (DMT)-like permease
MDSKEHRLAGQAALVLTAVLWSTSGLCIKLLDWHPVVITSSRSIVAVVFLLVVRRLTPAKGAKNRPFPLWAGAIAYAATMLTFVVANKLTTSANAIILQYGAPVWAALLGWKLNREKPHWEHWGALALVFAGLLVFFKDSLGSGSLLGDGIAVISGVAFGATSVFLRMMKDANPRDSLLLSHVICAVTGLPFIILYPPSFTALSLPAILYMGTVQLGLSSLIYAYGIKRISAVQAMLTAIIEPILNPVWVLLITGEKPALTALGGGAIIITAVVLSSLIGLRREERMARNAGSVP